MSDEMRAEYQLDHGKARPNRFAPLIASGELRLPSPPNSNAENPRKGTKFEEDVKRFLVASGISVTRGYSVPIGINGITRPHKFDLGSSEPRVVVECKCHSWTETGNAPSAKLSVWNEAMYYFSLVPSDYRKMMVVLLSRHESDSETLLAHYTRRFEHLIPCGVELWEYDPESAAAHCIYFAKRQADHSS